MSNKQNDIIIDNLIDRIEAFGIYELLITNDKGFQLTDIEQIEKYINFFESLNPDIGTTRYFWYLDVLKAKIKNDKWGESMRKQYPEFCNDLQHAYFLAGLTPTDGTVDTCTEFGTIKPEDNKKESTIL